MTKSKAGEQKEYHYTYDALGHRINKTTPEQSIDFFWNGDVLLSEQISNINRQESQSKIYLYEPDSFKPLAIIQDQQIYHYHLDHLGTPQELTHHNGELAWSVRYKAYGNVVRKEVEAIENNLRFQGQYYDVETGLYYNRHRYYDPTTARFINQDPIGLAGGNNNYQYASNPIAWVDPFGLKCKEVLALPKPKDSNPWMPKTKIESNVVDQNGLDVYRAHGGGRATGGWVTLNPPSNINYVRQDLAVSPDWNEATHVSKIKLAPSTRYQSGIAGPQNFPGGVGGVEQIQILNFDDILKQTVIKTSPLQK